MMLMMIIINTERWDEGGSWRKAPALLLSCKASQSLNSDGGLQLDI